MDKTAFARRLLDEPASYYYGVLWNKLYRASLIRDNGIRFSSDFDWSEDFLFNLEYIRYAEKFAALDRPVYYLSLIHISPIRPAASPASPN